MQPHTHTHILPGTHKHPNTLTLKIHVSADNVPISRRATMNNQLPEPTTKTVLATKKKVPEEIERTSVNK